MDEEDRLETVRKAVEMADFLTKQTEWNPETGTSRSSLSPEEIREMKARLVSMAIEQLEKTKRSSIWLNVAALASAAAAGFVGGALASWLLAWHAV